jgi:hypothetical protein
MLIPLIAAIALSGHASPPPAYAKFLGLTLGPCSTADLEAKIGPGKVFVGGHPNGARGWNFPDCQLSTDAFDRIGNAYLIYYFSIRSWKGRLGACRPFDKDKTWPLGELRYGESILDCADLLMKAGLNPALKEYGLECQDVAEVTTRGEKRKFAYTLTLFGGDDPGDHGLEGIQMIIDPVD